MRRAFKRKIRARFNGLLLKPFFGLLVRSRFYMSIMQRDGVAGNYILEEFNIQPASLKYHKEVKRSKEAAPVSTVLEKRILKDEYIKFLDTLIKAGFTMASDSVHYEYDGLPPEQPSFHYRLELSWANGALIDSIELDHNVNYGLDESVREKFEVFEIYLFQLAGRK